MAGKMKGKINSTKGKGGGPGVSTGGAGVGSVGPGSIGSVPLGMKKGPGGARGKVGSHQMDVRIAKAGRKAPIPRINGY